MNRQPAWPSALLTPIVLGLCTTSNCTAARPQLPSRLGVETCPIGAEDALLSVQALQCWFAARHGQWRTLSHQSHFDVLVVQVEALDLRDAEEIARRFVAGERLTFSEILVYVRTQSRAETAPIRRVRWTREKGSETIDFIAPLEGLSR
jgi:hypothetical protein